MLCAVSALAHAHWPAPRAQREDGEILVRKHEGEFACTYVALACDKHREERELEGIGRAWGAVAHPEMDDMVQTRQATWQSVVWGMIAPPQRVVVCKSETTPDLKDEEEEDDEREDEVRSDPKVTVGPTAK